VLKDEEPRRRRRKKRGKRWLLGLGLDGADGHVRYTKGENFRLIGGSEDTHGEMQEKVIHFNEELTKRNKELDDLTRPEFEDLARETGLKED
jgi:hypothetical protein